jgi:hypothetical protein
MGFHPFLATLQNIQLGLVGYTRYRSATISTTIFMVLVEFYYHAKASLYWAHR